MVHFTRVSLAFLTTAVALGASLSGVFVDAHGLLTTPQVEFTNDVMKTSFTEKMTSPFPGKFDGSPQENVNTFLDAYHNKYGADTPVGVFELIKQSGAVSECGNSLPHASPKPIPSDSKIVWENPDTHEGFVASHTGPCEVWLNEDIVFQDDNCAGHYPTASKAEISINFSKCPASGCLLRFYWLTFQEPNWQIYKNCIPLIGNPEVGAESTIMTTTSESSTPEPTEYSPSPSPSASNEYSPSPSPSATESSPSPTPTVAAAGDNSYLVADQPTESSPLTPESTSAPTSSSPASSEYTPAPVSSASPTVAHHKCSGKKTHEGKPAQR